jgi:hypothetical protein
MENDMTKALKSDFQILQKPVAVMALALLAGVCGLAYAQAAEPLSGSVAQAAFVDSDQPTPGQSVMTLRGPAIVTGTIGSMNTTTLPGGGGTGFLMNNGNGTSTLIVPGGAPQVVVTPR